MRAEDVRKGTDSTLRRDLHAMVGDGVAFAIMVGVGETFVPAFTLALGMHQVVAGLVATIPLLAGAILQLATPWAVQRLTSPKRWVVGCAILQATSLLLLPLCGLARGWATALVFAAVTLYWAAALASGPAWNVWAELLVPKPIRANFFGRRSQVCQLGTLAGFVLGGIVLHGGGFANEPIISFGVLFLTGACCRFASAAFLSRQSGVVDRRKSKVRRTHDRSVDLASAHFETPKRRPTTQTCDKTGYWKQSIGLGQMVSRMRGHAGARLIVYLLAVQTAVWIAGPFFTPYMLAQLHLTYAEFVQLAAIAYIARICAFPFLGRFAQRWGARQLLWIGGLGIIPLSALWIASNSLVYLSAIQFLAGVMWAAYELAMLLMFFEAIPHRERVSLLTLYNLGNAVAMVFGSLLGALLLRWFGELHSTYLLLFAVSSVARILTVPLLVRVPHSEFQPIRLLTRTLGVRPSRGALEAPVLPVIPNGESGAAVRAAGKTQSVAEEDRNRLRTVRASAP